MTIDLHKLVMRTEALNWNYRRLAREMNRTPQTICAIRRRAERGQPIKPNVIARVALALGCTMDDIQRDDATPANGSGKRGRA